MDTTLVCLGILPPTISTTPNSPRVCAKVITIPVNNEARTLGSNIFVRVVSFDFPKVNEASLREGGRFLKPDRTGFTIKGKLYKTDAITSPSNVNTSRMLKYWSRNLPKAFPGLK